MKPVAAVYRDDEKPPHAVVINKWPQTAQWKLQTQAVNIVGRDLEHRARIKRLQLHPAQLNIDDVFARCALWKWQAHDKSIVARLKSGVLTIAGRTTECRYNSALSISTRLRSTGLYEYHQQ